MPVKFPSAYRMSMIKIKSRCEFFVSQRLFSLQETRRFPLADTVNIMDKITSRLPDRAGPSLSPSFMPAVFASFGQFIPLILIEFSFSLGNGEGAAAILTGSILKYLFTESVAVITVGEWFCFFYVLQIIGIQHILSAAFAVMDSPFFQALRAQVCLHSIRRPGFATKAAGFCFPVIFLFSEKTADSLPESGKKRFFPFRFGFK